MVCFNALRVAGLPFSACRCLMMGASLSAGGFLGAAGAALVGFGAEEAQLGLSSKRTRNLAKAVQNHQRRSVKRVILVSSSCLEHFL
jgi:hypothetical protein